MNNTNPAKYKDLLEQISNLKNELDRLRPLDPEVEARLWRTQRMEWNYQANRFEGNRLTLSQTELLLDHDLSFDSSFREAAEMKAHDTAVELAREWSKDPNRPLTASDILELHQIVSVRFSARKSLTPQTGHLSPWNKVGNRFLFARAYSRVHIQDIHNGIALQIRPNGRNSDMLSGVIGFFHEMIRLKPFDENNVRVPLLSANMLFMRLGYPPICFRLEDKAEYFQAFKEVSGAISHPDGFFRVVAQQMIVSLKKAIAFVKNDGSEKAYDVMADIAAWKESVRPKTEGQTEKNDQLIFELFERDWAPLIQLYQESLAIFEDLFTESHVNEFYIHNGREIIRLWQVEEEIRYRKKKSWPDFQGPLFLGGSTAISFAKDFKELKPLRLSGGISVNLRIILLKYGYLVKFKETTLLNCQYNQPLTKEAMATIVDSCLKISFEEIKSKLKSNA